MKRILAIDYGSKRIGVAISDALGVTAQTPVGPVENDDKAVKNLLKIIEEYQVGKIVSGLPISNNGHEGISAAAVREFITKLEKVSGLPAVYVDERFTSVQARKKYPGKMTSAQRKAVIDNASAQIILEQYLASEDK